MTLIRAFLLLLLWATSSMSAILTVGTGGLCNGVATTYNETQLQTAVNAAVAGDEIVLCAGMTVTFGASLELDNDLTGWVTIRSSRSGELQEGYRVFPSDAAKMAKICSTSFADPVIDTKQTTKWWKLIGLEVSPCATGQLGYTVNLIRLGETAVETRIDLMSHDFVVDRCYIHGHPFDVGPWRGVLANSYSVQIINNYIDEIHPPFNTEGHGIGLWAGWDTTVRNNYVASGSEHIITGGAHATFQGIKIYNQRWVANHLVRPTNWHTLNYDADPEGTTLPDCVPAEECIASQTFHDTDDDIYYLRSGSAPPIWVAVNRHPANGPVCLTGRIWRNLTTDTVWQCVGGFWQPGGTNITITPVSSTNVVEGATTKITSQGVGQNGHFSCGDAYPNLASGCGTSTKGLYVLISGGTGDCTGINGRWRYTFSTDSPTGSVFTIPYNSTGQTCPNSLTLVRDFLWWGNKNAAEWKNVDGGLMEGNVIYNAPPFTWQSQKGAGFLKNWITEQDGPSATISNSIMINNVFDHVSAGLQEGQIEVDKVIGAGNITPGNPTMFTNTPSTGMTTPAGGEELCFSGGTGTWEGMNTCWTATVTGACGASSCNFSIPFNSAGMDDTGQSIRYTDNIHKKPATWPKRNRIYNNLWNVATPETLPGHAQYVNSGSVDATSGALWNVGYGIVFQFQFPSIIDHNTIIKQSFSPKFWLLGDFETRRLGVHVQSGRPPDAVVRMDMQITNNISDGSSGSWWGVDTQAECPGQLTEMAVAGGHPIMAGNAGNFAGIWHSVRSKTDTNYSETNCPGWRRVWDRSGTVAPATLTSVAVSDDDTACPDTPSAQQKMVLTWGAAARLLPGSWFRLSGYTTPSNAVDGLYQIPLTNPPGTAVVTHNSTAWAVCIGNIAAGTYTGGTWSSTMDFVDYPGKNYRLAASSPFKGQAADGSDPGADINVIEWSTEGTVSGAPNPYLDTHISSIVPSDTSATICFIAYDSSPATLTVSTSRAYAADLGTDTPNQTGRNGCTTVSGLTAQTRYYVRLNTAGRYKDTDASGEFAQFTTRQYAINESEYFKSIKDGIQSVRGTAVGSTVEFGCHLVFAQANGFVDDFPATYESLPLWTAYADNLKAAGCTKIVINISLRPWIANDTTDITRYTDLFTYIKTTIGLKLSLAPQASGVTKTAIQALPACPNGGLPCYDGTFDTPGDWFQGAKGAMAALAQLPSTARPHDIIVAHEPTTANNQLGISGSAAQWDPQVGNFANDATYGIQTIDTNIRVGAGCHQGELTYCQLFSDRAGVDFIGLDLYDHTAMGAALSIAADAVAADGTQKAFEIEETSRMGWTNTGTHSEQFSINGTGYERMGAPVCYDCQWIDAVVRRFSAAGATGVNIFYTQPLRYYAPVGSVNNGLSAVYNSAVAGTPSSNLTAFGQYVLAHPLLN